MRNLLRNNPICRAVPGIFLATLTYGQALSPRSLPQKTIDIGAQEAPLSDQERTDLAAAVTKHDYAAEKTVIDRAVAEHPSSPELQVMAGRLAYLEKNPKDAAEALERAEKIKPLSEDDRLTMGLAQQFGGEPARARVTLLKLTEDFPKNGQYAFLLGRFDVLNQRREDAVNDFRKALAIDPGMMRAYEELGQAQEALGLTDDARKTYEAGAVQNRRQKTPWEWSPLDLGVVLLKNEELDQAEKLFFEALQYNPRFGLAHYYLGQLDLKKGLRDRAIVEYQTAVVHTPTLKQAWLALGREYTRMGKKAEADKCLAVFKQLDDRENAAKGKPKENK